MSLTRDKLCSMVKKWQTLIEASVDVSTTDGYKIRMFCIGFTQKRTNQLKKTSYAQHTQVRTIRAKMVEIMTREVTTGSLRDLVNKLLPDSIAKDIEVVPICVSPSRCPYPQSKDLEETKSYLTRLMEMHGEGSVTHTKSSGDAGVKVERNVAAGMNLQFWNQFKFYQNF